MQACTYAASNFASAERCADALLTFDTLAASGIAGVAGIAVAAFVLMRIIF